MQAGQHPLRGSIPPTLSSVGMKFLTFPLLGVVRRLEWLVKPLNTSMSLFCTRPFEAIEISNHYDGIYFNLCCSAWGDVTIHVDKLNNPQLNILDVWNNTKAIQFRQSILDGSFSKCTTCPYLRNKAQPVCNHRTYNNPTVNVPTKLFLSIDPTCNLACPSCRAHSVRILENTPAYDELVKFYETKIKPLLSHIRLLEASGYGDPLASPITYHFLQSLTRRNYPNLRLHLHTNGLLFEEKYKGLNIPVVSIQISIDAACADTYAVNRKGGNWNNLLKNLEFIKQNKSFRVTFSFVVQDNNWREIPDFIELARHYHADAVVFYTIGNWGHYSEEEYLLRAVHLPTHPNYQACARLFKSIQRIQHPEITAHFPMPQISVKLL